MEIFNGTERCAEYIPRQIAISTKTYARNWQNETPGIFTNLHGDPHKSGLVRLEGACLGAPTVALVGRASPTYDGDTTQGKGTNIESYHLEPCAE